MFVLYKRDTKTSWFSDIFTYKQMVHLRKFAKDAGVQFIIQIEKDAFFVKNSLCKDEALDLGVEPPRIRLH